MHSPRRHGGAEVGVGMPYFRQPLSHLHCDDIHFLRERRASVVHYMFFFVRFVVK